jgi:hypothetical protein
LAQNVEAERRACEIIRLRAERKAGQLGAVPQKQFDLALVNPDAAVVDHRTSGCRPIGRPAFATTSAASPI